MYLLEKQRLYYRWLFAGLGALLLLSACTQGALAPSSGEWKEIGVLRPQEGGVLCSQATKVCLHFPKESTPQKQSLHLRRLPPEQTDIPKEHLRDLLGGLYELKSSKDKFEKTFEIKLPLESSMTGESLHVVFWHKDRWKPVPSRISSDRKFVIGLTDHLSIWTIKASCPQHYKTQCGKIKLNQKTWLLCANIKEDSAHCGKCGNQCPSGQPCIDGTCCAQTRCLMAGSTSTYECVDLQTSYRHCGKCGRVCPKEQICSAGVCKVPNCKFSRCGRQCVNTTKDPQNCGQCGKVCPRGYTCHSGKCQLHCQDTELKCNNVCVQAKADPMNCGGCGNRCKVGYSCTNGKCVRPQEWTRRAGGKEADFGQALALDGFGNMYVLGSFRGKATFGSITHQTSGIMNLFVAKLSPNGTFLWVEKIGGINAQAKVRLGADLTLDNKGNIYVTGSFNNTIALGSFRLTSAGKEDVFIAKIDKNRKCLWAVRAGGSNYAIPKRIEVDQSGQVYITGMFKGSARFGSIQLTSANNENHIFISKLSPSGKFMWVKMIGGKSTAHQTYISVEDLLVDKNGNSYLTGSFENEIRFGAKTLKSFVSPDSHSSTGDTFLGKLDSKGNILWAQSYEYDYSDRGVKLNFGKAGNIYLLRSAGALMKLTPEGHKLWVSWALNTFGSEMEVGFGLDNRGEILVAKDALYSKAGFTLYKLTPKGKILWKEEAKGSISIQDFIMDASGNYYLVGYFSGTARFTGTELTAAGGEDLFVAKNLPCHNCAQLCGFGLARCANTCVDLQLNNSHCGACGKTCPSGQFCVAGLCQSKSCTTCGSKCVYLTSDKLNCGKCGYECPYGGCYGGRCCTDKTCTGIWTKSSSCPSTHPTQCKSELINGQRWLKCVDTKNDAANCGKCNQACQHRYSCVEGTCYNGAKCLVKGYYERVPIWQNLQDHCGKCYHRCPKGKQCSNGKCVCHEEKVSCGGNTCHDLFSDALHCGKCHNKCPSGVCLNGKCVGSCSPKQSKCNGGCVDLQTDKYNCGQCGVRCAYDGACVEGKCVDRCLEKTYVCIRCHKGLSHCSLPAYDTYCANHQSDQKHCGKCQHVCSKDSRCKSGKCICLGGKTSCMSKPFDYYGASWTCHDLKTDKKHCGKCGNKCPGVSTCKGGACTCPAGQNLCADGCYSLKTDPKNCGQCSNQCAGSTPFCKNGTCSS